MDRWRYDPEMPVDTVMRTWPATIRIFLDRRMLCVGCHIAAFHTIAEACRFHGIDEEEFGRELGKAARSKR